jgi:hypothetical protein
MKNHCWVRQAFSICLTVSVFAASSFVALALPGKATAELMVNGRSLNGEAASVYVNGEVARTGRSIFSSSMVTTPDSASAIVNINKVAKIELAPGSSAIVTFDSNSASLNLSAGSVTVLNAAEGVMVTTADGETANLVSGEAVSAAGTKARQTDDDDRGGAAWWLWALVFGGAAAGIIYTAVSNDNRTALGGGGTVISPVR